MQCVICGLGGQGALFLSRVLARAGRRSGQGVLVGETHGMSQRGGSVFAFVKLGGYASSLVREGSADVVLCLAASQAASGIAYCKRGGVMVINAAGAEAVDPAVRKFAATRDVALHTVDAAGTALGLDMAKGFNVALLGFAAAVAPALPPAAVLQQTLIDISPERLLAGNQALFQVGAAAAVAGAPTGGAADA